MIYSRLLLAHVPDPAAIAKGWLKQLLPGGILLYAGAALGHLGGEIRRVTVPGSLAAHIYLFNVRRWQGDPTVPVAEDHLKALEDRLVAAAGDDDGTTVSWVVRQLCLHA